MLRSIYAAAALTVVWCSCGPLWAARSELISETTIARHGLTRSWFAQVEFDQGRAKLEHVIYYEGVLYAQTDTAIVHAIDAETGKTLWTKPLGDANHPSMTPDANGNKLAMVNGSRLYVVDRFNGDPITEIVVRDPPGAGAALSAKRAYVPTVGGMLLSYSLEKDKKGLPPLSCQSNGRALVQPLVTRQNYERDYVVWTTDRGYVNFGRITWESEKALTLTFRLATGSMISARPAYLPPDPKVVGDSGVVFAAAYDGMVFAIQEEDGATLWQFPTSEPIVESPAVIDDRVYITTQLGGMYCLDVKTGKNLWSASGAMQFVAASKSRIYATDRIGRLMILDAVNGNKLDSVAVENVSMKLANSDTDRIYLISDGGLIQCLHEVELNEPLIHGKDRKDAAKAEAEAKPAVTEHKKVEETDKPEKKVHHESKAATPSKKVAPKEKAAPKEQIPKTPKVPKKNKKAEAANEFGNDQAGEVPQGQGNGKNNKGKKGKMQKNGQNMGFQ
jgi:outer membrane protein assembly factor BamB